MQTNVLCVTLAAMFTSAFAFDAAAGDIDVQAPCPKNNNGYCDVAATLPVTVRSYSFKRARSGRALITFEASLVCDNLQATPATAQFFGQIATGASDPPNFQQPGGWRSTEQLPASDSMTVESTDNFSVSREISYGAGKRTTVYFNFDENYNLGLGCVWTRAAFTAVFSN
mgnify:CR=1 FL=1